MGSRFMATYGSRFMIKGSWLMIMTQEEKWMIHYNEVKTFIETYHRNPSKYVDSERGLRNWVKQQKKLLNAGALEGQRLMMFNELLALEERYKRKNQYE